MKAIIPDNFDISRHLQTYPPLQYGFRKFNVDHALYLLSQITLAPAQDQQLLDNMDIEHNYTLLYSNILQAKVHNYRRYLDFFIYTHVIECDNQFIRAVDRPGEEKSLGYRFTSEYQSADLQTIEYGKAWQNVLKKKERINYKELKNEYGHLVKWLWPSCDIQIDYNEALNWLKLRKKAQMRYPELRTREFNRKKRRIEIKNPITQFRFAKANILSLYLGDLHCSVNKTSNRMHTVFTNMKSELRNFLTCNGKTLVSIDVKNCQPYLIMALFNKELYATKRNGVNLTTMNNELYGKIKADLELTDSFFESINNEDVKRYKSLVSEVDGNPLDLYTYMLAECGRYGISYKNRSEVKVGMYEVLFTANQFCSNTKKLFKQLFPTIDDLCRRIKKGGKAYLSCLLQSIESHIVLKVITKRMESEFLKARFITIHDSVVTTEEYAEA